METFTPTAALRQQMELLEQALARLARNWASLSCWRPMSIPSRRTAGGRA
jgi:muramidase (phage lysozyme)